MAGAAIIAGIAIDFGMAMRDRLAMGGAAHSTIIEKGSDMAADAAMTLDRDGWLSSSAEAAMALRNRLVTTSGAVGDASTRSCSVAGSCAVGTGSRAHSRPSSAAFSVLYSCHDKYGVRSSPRSQWSRKVSVRLHAM